MPMLTGARTETVRTKTGHTVSFEKDKDVFVPEDANLVKICTKLGHKVVKDRPAVKEVKEEPVPTPVKRAAPKSSVRSVRQDTAKPI